MRRRFIISLMVFILSIFIDICPTYAESIKGVTEIEAPSAILIEVGRGQVLFEKNSELRLHISSASKIMTAVLALEKIKSDTTVTISKESVGVKGSILNLEAGDKYNAVDLITAILLTPANDAASALAEFVSGDIKSFVDVMNAKAKELNMADTMFVNPTGLFDAMQYSTARDISKLIKYALINPEFNRIFSIKGLPFNSQILINHNKLFWSYEGVDGGKAGYNELEKQSTITTATKGNLRLAAIILDSPGESIWGESEMLLDYGFNNFKSGILISKGQILKNTFVKDKEIGLMSLQDIYYTYPVGESFVKKVDFELPKEFKLPVTKTEPLGNAIYILKDETKISIPLYSNIEIKTTKSFKDYVVGQLMEVKVMVYIVVILLLVELIIVIYKITKYVKRRSVKKL